MRLFRLILIGLMVARGLSSIGFAQSQTCPINFNFSVNDLSAWKVSTNLVGGAQTSYSNTAGIKTIPEQNTNFTGIEVITSSSTDHFGKFPTIPTINGYTYEYAVKLGSSKTSFDMNSGVANPGGFTRTISYEIDVPPGATTVPYTITYAYALVLENGTHNSVNQPFFSATLQTSTGIVPCASPKYFLPTLNDANQGPGGNTGATLDSAGAKRDGFSVSPELFLSFAGVNNRNGTWLQDVWTKNWTEVAFDLSPYRGQKVTLTFQARNCEPGAHFAYAYVALRKTCAGLEMSGTPIACTNSRQVYSVPALPDATYTWNIPAGWSIVSGANTNAITVLPGTDPGTVSVLQKNSCATLQSNLPVTTKPSTLAGAMQPDAQVCAGNNSTTLQLTGSRGQVLTWLRSPDGTDWTALNNQTLSYTAQQLTSTTYYAALVQNGEGCSIDTSTIAGVLVDQLTQAGNLFPESLDFCFNQPANQTIELTNQTGSVLNWLVSTDNSTYTPTNHTDPSLLINSLQQTVYYKTIVQNGVCPPDTTNAAVVNFHPTPYPEASVSPATAAICYGDDITLTGTISLGTRYNWILTAIPPKTESGLVFGNPFNTEFSVQPNHTSTALLQVFNDGCPNMRTETAVINVTPPINVFAGNDTVVVINQPVQLFAVSDVPEANSFQWQSGNYLSNPNSNNPVALFNLNSPSPITYVVTASTPDGCTGTDTIQIKIYKTPASIFVPNAFTPNGDGHNDVLTPIYAGMRQVNYFSVFNRWGQLVFSTNKPGVGWDGKLNGQLQASDTYVYQVQGIDYNGQIISAKGHIVLIR